MIHDHHGKPLDAPGKKWSSCLLHDWPLLYGVLCTGIAHANFSALVQNARKRNAAVPMASHKWEQTVTWLEQNHHLKLVQHLVTSRCQICWVGWKWGLHPGHENCSICRMATHKAFSSNMFKEPFEIEFRVSHSEPLVLAVQLFQKAFHVCWGVHGPHLMHRRWCFQVLKAITWSMTRASKRFAPVRMA